MKKTLVLASLLAAFGAVSAQSSVTLYGVVDADIGQSKTTTTTAAGVSTVVSSSALSREGRDYGLSGSRFGFKGTEALGGGMTATFQTEHGTDAYAGRLAQGINYAGASTSGRQTWVGLNGAFGTVSLGRQYTPFWGSVAGNADYDGLTGAYSTTSQNNGNAVRASGALKFSSANYSGLSFSLLAGKDKATTTAAGVLTANAVTNTTGASVSYVAGPLGLHAAVNTVKALALAPAFTKVSDTGVTATYDLGVAKLYANFMSNKNTNNTLTTNNKTNELNFNVSVPFGAAYVVAGVGTNKVTNTAAATTAKGTDYMVGAGYKLSGRTDLYARVGKNQNLTQSAGSKSNSQAYGLGVRHAF